ncbi:fringe-related protein [Zea mays]|uniref:Fringe-related protein n=1 Tax=Zea mays TaxID=4577 RepID=A0A1D6JUC3_MAIZE|nr:fringe-related protein [Zea mays]ONL95417.1 fringe-related protein [Zea mays]ONL95418.1 fringe-related protein [Zea mays]
MAELGVLLTKHLGFHQYDVYGDLLGLLASHPVAPIVMLHHLDVVKPLFPDARSRPSAVRRLFDGPVKLDTAGLMQQSICYDSANRWTVSVAWGFTVLVVRGIMSPREMEMSARTFLNWYRRADYTAYAFNTRPLARSPCQKPVVYYLSSEQREALHGGETTVTRYERWRHPNETRPACRWDITDPDAHLDHIIVLKKPDPRLW